MSVDEKWTWKPLTPASVPAGARISAGKSGNVLISLPTSAEVSVNCVPASCIPSPESPANRMVTDGNFVIGLRVVATPVDVVPLVVIVLIAVLDIGSDQSGQISRRTWPDSADRPPGV